MDDAQDLALSEFPGIIATGVYDAATLRPSVSCVKLENIDRRTLIWHRRRPEYWYGIFYLPTFWLTAGFGLGLVWSLWKDRKTLRII